ncbi:MAG: branched-chain amino acid transaminase [Coriobacteriales bacterium]|jgi:branched-chain amino acid aminotransferase|nr:branched-chain amino acid transaminase [Coriobacteriales bacterium]
MADIQEGKYIWKNGDFVAWADATTHVLSHALHYGTAVFEGIRCYKTENGSAVFRLKDHMERFVRSARIIMMPLAYSAEELTEAALETIRRNELESCYIRPIAYRGYGAVGVNPSSAPIDVAIAVWPWDAYLGATALEQGIAVGISSWRQRGTNAIPGAVKSSASYLNSGLANMEAVAHGYGEAILLNESGYVAEGSGENIFAVRNGLISTPPLSDGILEGLTRNSVIQIAQDLGYTVLERSLVRTDLYVADEVFFTGTAAELTPINSVDGREIGKPGPITKQLQQRFFDVVAGRVPQYAEWLDKVEGRLSSATQ